MAKPSPLSQASLVRRVGSVYPQMRPSCPWCPLPLARWLASDLPPCDLRSFAPTGELLANPVSLVRVRGIEIPRTPCRNAVTVLHLVQMKLPLSALPQNAAPDAAFDPRSRSYGLSRPQISRRSRTQRSACHEQRPARARSPRSVHYPPKNSASVQPQTVHHVNLRGSNEAAVAEVRRNSEIRARPTQVVCGPQPVDAVLSLGGAWL